MLKKNKASAKKKVGLDFEDFLDCANDLIQSVGSDGAYLHVNQCWVDTLGYSEEEAKRLNFKDVVREDCFEHCMKVFEGLGRGKSCKGFEVVFRTRDGRDVMVEGSLVGIIHDGKLAATLGVFRDITDRKHAEIALKESEERFRNLMEFVPDVSIQGYDVNGKVLYWNRMSEELYGYTSEEAVGKNLGDLIIPPDLQQLFKKGLKVGAGLKESGQFSPPGEVVLRRKDGSSISVYSIHTAVCIEGQKPTMFCLDIDLAERKQAEGRFRMAAEVLSDLIYEWEVCSDTLEWFGGVDEKLGYENGEIPRTIAGWAGLMHPEDQKRLKNSVERHRKETSNIIEEYRVRRKDGTWAYWADLGKPVLDANGKPIRWVGACTDITERKCAEVALKENEEKYRILYETSADAVMTLLPGGHFVSGNPAALKMFGCIDEAGFIAQRPSDLSPEYQPDGTLSSEKANEMMGLAIEKGAHLFEWTHKRINGEEFPATVLLSKMQMGDENILQAAVRDITEQKQEGEARALHVRFLEKLERVDRVILEATDAEQMMSDVLDVVLEIFEVDRAWLLYPCDPEAKSWSVPMERTRPEYPGAFSFDEDIAMRPEVAGVMRNVLSMSDVNAVDYSEPGSATVTSERFSIRAEMNMAVYPQVDEPWMFGVHQCSHDRVWTNEDKELFHEVGRRLSDSLGNMLLLRNLRESEARLRQISEGSSEWVWDIDLDGLYAYSNSAVEQMLGYGVEEVVGKKHYYDFFFPGKRDVLMKTIQQIFEKKEPIRDLVNLNQHRDGSEVWLSTSAFPVLNDEGRLIGYRGVDVDITKRKRAEDDLLQKNEQMEMVMRGANLGWWDWDIPSGKEIYNEILPKNLGYDLSEIEPNIEWWKDKIHPDDLERVESGLQEHFDGKTEFYADKHRLKTKSGEWRRFLDYGKVVSRDEGGKPLRMIGTLRDIDDQERSDSLLKENEKKMRNLVENSTNLFYSHTAEGKITYISPQCREYLQCEPEEAMVIWTELITDNPINDIGRELTQKAIETGRRQPIYELELKGKMGKKVWSEAREAPIVENGKTVAIVGSLTDISERRRAEQRVAAINDCFFNLGADYDENVNAITKVCGEIFGAVCAIYNRLDGPMLCTRGVWHQPPGYNPKDKPDGHICYDVIREAGDDCVIIRDLQNSEYINTDPNVRQYKLQTYVGHAVRLGSKAVGSLCVLFQEDREPAKGELDALGALASALGVEEDRRRSRETLQDKLRDLAKLNELMFGRERRVLELKEEINELLEGMGKECRYTV